MRSLSLFLLADLIVTMATTHQARKLALTDAVMHEVFSVQLIL
jgi:hypothetical protein